MITITAEVEGDIQLDRRLGFIGKAIDDFSSPLEASENSLMKSFDENFSARGQLFGGWAPRKKLYDWPLLEQTGETREGFVGAVTRTQLVIGNTSEKFPFHQSNKPRSKLPRRVMMMIDAQRKREIQKHFQEFVAHILQQRG